MGHRLTVMKVNSGSTSLLRIQSGDGRAKDKISFGLQRPALDLGSPYGF